MLFSRLLHINIYTCTTVFNVFIYFEAALFSMEKWDLCHQFLHREWELGKDWRRGDTQKVMHRLFHNEKLMKSSNDTATENLVKAVSNDLETFNFLAGCQPSNLNLKANASPSVQVSYYTDVASVIAQCYNYRTVLRQQFPLCNMLPCMSQVILCCNSWVWITTF